jgi:alpha-L-rhamnosidase
VNQFLLFTAEMALISAACIATSCSSAAAAPADAVTSRPSTTSVTEFGAVGDDRTLNTTAIQGAIDKISASGGGTLVVPEGVFLSGALYCKPGVDLRLETGAVLKGSTDIHDYPTTNTRIEGHFQPWRPALLNADGVDHLRITGPGTLDGNGVPYWAAFWKRRHENPNCTNMEVERPRILFIENSQDVQISGITLKDSGFWNLHLYRCQDAVIDGLNIHVSNLGPHEGAPSTDGMDIDSSQRVTIRNCTFAVNDDCIALKGTKGPFALDDKLSGPVEHIRVSGCTFKAGHAALTCGSEATIVRDVLMEHCTVAGAMPLLHLKLRPDTPQCYQDIHVNDVVLHKGWIFNVSPWTQFFDLKGQPAPQSTIRGVSVSGVSGSFASLGWIKGNPGTKITGITLENFDVRVKSDQFPHQAIEGLTFNNVRVNGETFTSPAGAVDQNSDAPGEDGVVPRH